MKIVNPYTEVETDFQEMPTSKLEVLYSDLVKKQKVWTGFTVEKRAQALAKIHVAFKENSEKLARMISSEMGKPVKAARVEIARTIDEIVYMVSNAAAWLADEEVSEGFVRYDPLGVVAVISPWNFPFLLPMRGIVPALLAGNAVIYKPSELSPACGQELYSILINAAPDLPFDVAAGGKELGARVVKLPVSLIAFTGSCTVGKQIFREAASNVKRVLLELGGLDPAIVLADADIESAAKELVMRNALNSGQVCNAVKRIYVEKSVYERFLSAAKEASRKFIYGDPLEEKTDLGPLVSSVQLKRVREFLEDAVSRGAKAIPGAETLPSRGYFMAHTILVDVPESARVLHEEPFGPLLPVIPVDSEDQAIRLANQTSFGLTASVWSGDRQRAFKIAGRLETGLVGINSHRAGPPGTPWGGNKESGIGRMKTRAGLHEFCNVKYIHLSAA